jgi:hypothetical protein
VDGVVRSRLMLLFALNSHSGRVFSSNGKCALRVGDIGDGSDAALEYIAWTRWPGQGCLGTAKGTVRYAKGDVAVSLRLLRALGDIRGACMRLSSPSGQVQWRKRAFAQTIRNHVSTMASGRQGKMEDGTSTELADNSDLPSVQFDNGFRDR